MEPNFTCLVVEDDPEDQEIFSLALEGVGFPVNCIFISNAEEALEQLKQKRVSPQYIFLDLNMPRLSGFQCLEEIKKIQGLDHIPVAIYSTSSESIYREEAARHGAAAFITKPVRINDFSAVLRDFFNNASPAS